MRVTPIAFPDTPSLNVAGVHEPWALRSIIEVETVDGQVGLVESYGDLQILAKLTRVAPQLIGIDVFENVRRRARTAQHRPSRQGAR